MGKTANDVIRVMQGWLGYSESDGRFRQIIDLYNSVSPLPRGYKVRYTDEWCDTTVSAAGIKAGCSDLIGRECSCTAHIRILKELGCDYLQGYYFSKPIPQDAFIELISQETAS